MSSLRKKRKPFAYLRIDKDISLEPSDGSPVPASFQRPSPAFDDVSGKSFGPNEPIIVKTPLGKAVRIHSGAANLFERALSLGQSLGGLSSTAELSLSNAPGAVGPGCIVWKPTKDGDALDIECPGINPVDFIPGPGAGIFVAARFSAYFKTDVALNLEMVNPDDPQYPRATPQFVGANSSGWQRGAVAVRIMKRCVPSIRIVARGAGTVRMDGLQLDPRPYPTWMVSEPLTHGCWSAWVAGGERRAHDSLSAPLPPGVISRAGAISVWFRSEWPTADFPHTVVEAATDALGMWFDNFRLNAAAGGTQVWFYDGWAWLTMLRFEIGRWHHAVLTWNVDGEVSLYLDGECHSRRATLAALRLDPEKFTSLSIGMPSDPVGYQGLASLPSRLDGTLADLRIYQAHLDDSEVAALTLAGKAKLDPDAFAKPPRRHVELAIKKSEVIAQGAYYCWFPNTLAILPDGTVETIVHRGPDYGPPLPDYWMDEKEAPHFFRKSVEEPWKEGPGHGHRQPIRLPDGRWLRLVMSRKTALSKDGKNWEEFDVEIENLPPGAKVGTHLQRIDHWQVDSQGRLLALGLLHFEKPSREPSMREQLFGGTEATGTQLFFAVADPRNPARLRILSLITGGQAPPFGDYNEENTFVETTPGEILLVGRIFGHNLPCFQTRSTDGGLTWSRLELCPFGAVWPRVVKDSNGIVYCHASRPEAVIHWTADGGRTWSAPMTMVDSREVPLQAMNVWYGASTGYGELTVAGPNRIYEAHDVLGAYDPGTMRRLNECRFTDITTSVTDSYDAKVKARLGFSEFVFNGKWQSDAVVGEKKISVWTEDPEAGVEIRFDGSGISLMHPLMRHGGDLVASIDGELVKRISLYSPLPHHRFGRTLIASGLKPGPHTLTLKADLSGSARHAHGDGVELEGFHAWLYLTRTTARRWAALCFAEVLG